MTATIDDLGTARIRRMMRTLGMDAVILWAIAWQDAHIDLTGRTLDDLTPDELDALTRTLTAHLANEPTT